MERERERERGGSNGKGGREKLEFRGWGGTGVREGRRD